VSEFNAPPDTIYVISEEDLREDSDYQTELVYTVLWSSLAVLD